MAKKDPSSPEWLARCTDIVTALSDGSRDKTAGAGWSMYITLPPFSDLRGFGESWHKLAEHAAELISDRGIVSEVLVSKGGNPRTQYFMTRNGGFRDLEDHVLGSFEEAFGPIMGPAASVWKNRLEQTRPTASADVPGKLAADLETAFPAGAFAALPDVREALDKTGSDAFGMGLLPVLISARGAIETKFPDHKQALASCIDGLLNYRNTMRMKTEIWIERAFLPISAPYLAPLFKSQSGETPSFADAADYWRKLSQHVFSEEFSKMPRMALESAGIANSKTFPVSPFRLRTGAPFAVAKEREVQVKFGWLQARLHWKLQNAVIAELTRVFPGAEVTDSRDSSKQKMKYPDPFGIETINTQQISVKAKSPDEAGQIADEMNSLISSLYLTGHRPAAGRFEGADVRLRSETDVITEKQVSDQESRLEKKRSMKISDRIVPYASKSAVYIQVAGSNLPEALYEAIKETIAAHPAWNVAVSSDGMSNYISLHLNSPRTGEGCGLAERGIIAHEVSRLYKEKTGEDRFPVEYPDSGYRIEVSRRKINPQDKNDESAGIYIKIPSAFAPGGSLEEKSIEDESFIEGLDPVSKGFCMLNEEFGRGARTKSILKLCAPASSPLEVYTRTWLYRIKPEDSEDQKTGEIRKAVEERVLSLFPPDVPVELDWMPDRAARKLETINSEIEAFSSRWTDTCGAEILAAKDLVQAER